jgi:hypothetical membrane protein
MYRHFLLLGPLAGILFFATVYLLAALLPDYSHLAETVSEIGELGSPVALPFQVGMLAVNLCVILFGVGLLRVAGSAGVSKAPAIFVIYFGVMDIGTNVFPSPHPLHNLFGLSLTIGYLAPLVTAITWRRADTVRSIAAVSIPVAVLIFVSIFLNISPAFNRDLYPLEYYGVVQRSIFVLFYGWCAYVGLKAWTMASRTLAS